MWNGSTPKILIASIAFGMTSSIAFSDEGASPTNPPKAPAGYVLVEDNEWHLLADEPGHHVGRARDAFSMWDARLTAAELRKAAAHIRIAASDATERSRQGLIHAEQDLKRTAERIEAGSLKSLDDFDFAVARAMHTLSEYQYLKAAAAWRKKEIHQAGHYLRASADNIERAAARTENRMKLATAEVARESRTISGSLIEGTGYAVDEVGTGFEKIGHQIERVGTKVIASSNK